MRARKRFSQEHPVDIVHRVSAVLLGLGLWAFAALGFANSLDFFSVEGEVVLGLSTNGALSTISLLAGAALIAGAVWGGSAASTITTVIGALFLLSGLVHLAILNTAFNVLAFRLANVFFSLVAGMLLLFSGLYGRLSGGLPPDNPYRQAHPRRTDRPDPREQLAAGTAADDDETEQSMLAAEIAMGEGTATPEQQDLVKRDQARRRAGEIERAWRHAHEEDHRAG